MSNRPDGAVEESQSLVGVWIAVAVAGAAICCLFIYFVLRCIYDNDDLELKVWNNRAFQPKDKVVRKSTEFDDSTNTTHNGLKNGYMDQTSVNTRASAVNSAQHKVNFDPYMMPKNQVYPSPSIIKKTIDQDLVVGGGHGSDPTPELRRFRNQPPRRRQTVVRDRRSKDRSYDIYGNDDRTGYKTPDSELVEIDLFPDHDRSRETRPRRDDAYYRRRDHQPTAKERSPRNNRYKRSPHFDERYGYFSDDSRYSDYDRARRQKRRGDDYLSRSNARFIEDEVNKIVKERLERESYERRQREKERQRREKDDE